MRILDDRPDVATLLQEELSPGTGPCEIHAGEVDEALRGTVSPHPVVRRHAVNVIGQRRLGAAVGRWVLPVLARLPVDDPDPTVRQAAESWLRDAGADHPSCASADC